MLDLRPDALQVGSPDLAIAPQERIDEHARECLLAAHLLARDDDLLLEDFLDLRREITLWASLGVPAHAFREAVLHGCAGHRPVAPLLPC